MNNNTILDNRWKYTDDRLKEYLKVYKKVSARTQDNIQDIFNSISYGYVDLNKPISAIQRKKFNRVIDEWKENGLLNGYFKYRVEELAKKRYITNEEVLEVLLWGAYVNERSQLEKYEQQLFIDVGNDLYAQGNNEINPKEKKHLSLTWEYIWSLLTLPNVKGNKWTTYIEAIALTYAQDIKRQAMINLQQNKELNIFDDIFQSIIKKQQNKYLSINGDKISGALDSQVAEIANQSLLKAGEDAGNKQLQVRFISEIDERTTDMCLSMNNMLFNVNDWNRFYRYSASDGKNVFYTVEGLKPGINLPPINNHFHYCRSTITYLVDMPRDELNKKLQTFNEKLAITKWLSSDFYLINEKMYYDQKLTEEEKRLVKDLYRGLNKETYYNAKDNEYIVRVVEADDSTLERIISSHQINKVYKSKAFESYSLKDGYNPNANVFFYVKGSKKAKNMLEYNPMEREAEVLYQYGTKFVTRDYYTKNGKHYFLLEEL